MCQPDFTSVASGVGGRLGLRPSRIRAKLVRKKAEDAVQVRLDAIRQSVWFDQRWYLETYPDVESPGIDAVRHYYEFGWKEDRNPSPGFDTCYYMMSHLDVAKSGLNPLWLFVAFGRSEERRVGKECVRTGSSRWAPDSK